MSYQSWHDYGIGFNFSDFDAACDKAGDPIIVEDIERLLAEAPELREAVHEWLNELRENDPEYQVTIQDYRDFDQDFQLELASLFADTVVEAEGLSHVFAAADYNCNHYVLFGQGYPWNMSDREKALKRDAVEEIFRKYLAVLKPGTKSGAPNVEIDDQAVENGG